MMTRDEMSELTTELLDKAAMFYAENGDPDFDIEPMFFLVEGAEVPYKVGIVPMFALADDKHTAVGVMRTLLGANTHFHACVLIAPGWERHIAPPYERTGRELVMLNLETRSGEGLHAARLVKREDGKNRLVTLHYPEISFCDSPADGKMQNFFGLPTSSQDTPHVQERPGTSHTH